MSFRSLTSRFCIACAVAVGVVCTTTIVAFSAPAPRVLRVREVAGSAVPERTFANWRTYALAQTTPAVGIAFADGASWFTTGECCGPAPAFARISLGGKITQYYAEGFHPGPITAGPGSIFMDDVDYAALAAYVPRTRQLTVYQAYSPTEDQPQFTTQLALAPTGDLWYAEYSHVARLEPGGTIVEYATDAPPAGPVILGPDGRMWFALTSGVIGAIDPVTFAKSQVRLPPDSCNSANPYPTLYSLTSARGDVYATCYTDPYTGPSTFFYRIDARRTRFVRSYGSYALSVYGMTGGRDGKLYLAEGYPPAVGFFDPRQGALGYYYSPNGDGVGSLTFDPSGNVWGIMGPHPAIGTLMLRSRSFERF